MEARSCARKQAELGGGVAALKSSTNSEQMTPQMGADPSANPSMGRRLWRWRKLLTSPHGAGAILLILLIASTILYQRRAVRQWLAEPAIAPARLNAKWQALLDDARVAPYVEGEDEGLREALEALRQIKGDELERAVLLAHKPGERTRAHQNLLHENAALADSLVAWASAGGGLDLTDPCRLDADYPVRDLFLLSRVIIAQGDVGLSEPHLDDRLRAVSHLARLLRGAGGPLPLVAGMRITGHAMSAAERWQRTGEMVRMREDGPSRSEVWRALATEAACVDSLLGRHFAEMSDTWGSSQMKEMGAPVTWFEPYPGYLQRERRMVRAWYIELLDRARPHRRSLDEMAKRLELSADESALPASVAVRLVAIDLSEPVREAAKEIEKYESAITRWSAH